MHITLNNILKNNIILPSLTEEEEDRNRLREQPLYLVPGRFEVAVSRGTPTLQANDKIKAKLKKKHCFRGTVCQ